MAGGEGSRLRPLTINRPKPMVPVVGRPVMEHILTLLRRHGITECVVTVQYLANAIQDYFGDGRSLGMKLIYAVEETPLGTAGSVKNATKHLNETFLVVSGDAVTDFDLTRIVDFHRRSGSVATLTLTHVPNPLDYGVVIVAKDGGVRQFLEKPSWGEVFSDTVNTGIYVLEPQVLDRVPANESYDFSQDVFPALLQDDEPLFGYVAEGYWCDVGNIPEYMRANAEALTGRVQLEIPGDRQGEVWRDLGVEVAPDAQLIGAVCLGQDVTIKSGVVLRGPCVIGDYTVVDERALVDRSVIWTNCYLGERVEVRGAIIGKQCALKSRAVIFEGAVVGDSSIVGEQAMIHSDVKIWPNKEVETGATVASSIIWGSQGRRSLFGRFGVTGLVNIDCTPEFAAKLAAAYGAILPKGSDVLVNRDPHRSPRMIKRAMIAGLPSTGINVIDIKNVPIPVARFTTRNSHAAGCVHVRLSPFDDRVVDIRFLDSKGLNLDKNTERKIESAFFREDFRRVFLDDIGTITDGNLVIENYVRAFMAHVDVTTLQEATFDLVVDYAHASSSLVLPEILNNLGCNVVAINSGLQENKLFNSPEQFNQGLLQLATITSTLRYDLGVRIDIGGERVYLVDDTGRILPSMTALAAVARLTLEQNPGGVVAVPVTAPSIFEAIAERHGGSVVRTKVNETALMAVSGREQVALVGDGEGGMLFPGPVPGFDGMMSLAKILELLAKRKTKFSELVATLPQYHMRSSKVPCPWEYKGKVMRVLSEQFRDRRSKQIDGIRIDLGSEWVLVLPDADRPLFHVMAEGSSPDAAQSLVDKYAAMVGGLQH